MNTPVQALVLNRYLYGESSLILRLLTEKHGIISGVIKGARSAKKWTPETGSVIEMIPQRKRDEGLFSLSNIEFEHTYAFSDSLVKSAVRDTAFELTLAIVHEEESLPELYALMGNFLHHIEGSSEPESLFSLWLVILRLGDILGVRLERTFCISCKGGFENGGELSPEQGGFLCESCRPGKSPLFSSSLLSLLATGTPSADQLLPHLSTREKMGVTSLLIENLRNSFEFHRQIRSLTFLAEVL